MTTTAELIKQSVVPEDVETANDTAAGINDFDVKTSGAYTDAGAILAEVKSRRKRLETARDKIAAPLKEALDEVKNFFNPPIDKFKMITSAITAAMTRFEIAEKERAERHLTLVASGESADVVGLEVAVPKVEGMSSRVAYDIGIVSAAKLPVSFLTSLAVDLILDGNSAALSAVRKAALSGQLTEAHGVKLIEKRIITNRGR